MSSLCAATTAGQCTVRLDPAAGTAEVVEWEPGTPLSPVTYESVLPDGEIAEGVWDGVVGERKRRFSGVRVTRLMLAEDRETAVVEFERVEYSLARSRISPGDARQVNQAFIADPVSAKNEVALYLVMDPRSFELGTAVSDGDACTMPAFSKMSDGRVEDSIWEEHVGELSTTNHTFLWPWRIRLQRDGTYYLQMAQIGRETVCGPPAVYEPGYTMFNPMTEQLNVPGCEHAAD